MKFCQHCGAKRVPGAKFCTECGAGLAVESGPVIATTGAVVLGSLILFAIIRFAILDKAPPAHDDHAGHDHPHETSAAADHADIDDPKLDMLKAHAEGGTAGALLDLAEYQGQLGARNRDFLFQAASTLESFDRKYPDHPYTLRLLGNIYFDVGMPEKAVEIYKRYLAIHPEDANVRTDLGTQLLQLKRDDEAIAEYKRAIEQFPNFYNAHFNLHIAYTRMKDEKNSDLYRAKADEIAAEFGKVMPPFLELERLPKGASAGPNTAIAGAGTVANYSQDAGRYAALEKFFRDHAIIGPKIVDFRNVDDKAILKVRRFPMDQIPESMRGSLDAKINAQMAEAGQGAILEIVDADTNKVMGEYKVD